MAVVYNEADFERWFRDPRPYLGNVRSRKAFRDWAGDRFAEWYERGHEMVRLTGDETGLSGFEAEMVPGRRARLSQDRGRPDDRRSSHQVRRREPRGSASRAEAGSG